jgi:hypothetical protein
MDSHKRLAGALQGAEHDIGAAHIGRERQPSLHPLQKFEIAGRETRDRLYTSVHKLLRCGASHRWLILPGTKKLPPPAGESFLLCGRGERI